MKEQLRYWRDLTPETKKQIMQSKSITAITFEQIKTVYAEKRK